MPGLESSTATSTTNASIVQASFTYGTDLATAEQKMTQAINRISSQLPDGVEPNVISASIDDFPVIQVAVTGYDDAETIQAQLEASVIPELEDVAGVNAAQIVGGVGQRVTITPDQEELAAAGYTQQAIRDALDQNGVLFPGGDITEDDADPHRPDRLEGHVGRRDRRAAARAVDAPSSSQAGAITIADVATVEQDQDPVTTISRVDGEPAITIAVTKLPSANTVDVSKGVLAVLPDLEDDLDGATFTVVFDQAPYIQQSIESLAIEGLLGLFFAVLVILVFLLSVRATLVTAISIPTSVLITFIGIQAFGYSLNILTLGALTIAIGRVVDDSIVVIENIKRHYVGDADKKASILRAVREVATRDHVVDHHDGRRVPADRLRRRHHGRALPPVRPDDHDRDGRLAARRAHDRAGARVLVPAPRQAAARRRGRADRPRGVGRPAEPPAEGLPADPALDAHGTRGSRSASRCSCSSARSPSRRS